MANIESKVSVTRNGSDMEITSVVTVPGSAADKLVDYVKSSVEYWLENMTQTPSPWMVTDMVNRLGIRDSETKAALITFIQKAFANAVDGESDDEDSYWEELTKAANDALDNLTDEEKGKALSGYVQRNIDDVENALESPCCCYGMDYVDDEFREIVMRKIAGDRVLPTVPGIEIALLEYIDETPPKQVTLERLQAIVTAVFMGSTATVAAGDIGDGPSGWDPK